jgi:transposase
MATTVRQTNKSTGITYVYESISYWDKTKQQSRAKRVCIGKVDPETGNVVPTRKTKSRSVLPEPSTKPGPVPTTQTARFFGGATYLFDEIGRNLGITSDLKHCFPEFYRLILSVAYYLILEDNNPLSRFPKWATLHKHPFGRDISSQRSSELFAAITEEARTRFFERQGKRRVEKEYWAYDITSISSYSNTLAQVKYGLNKDHDPLAQINLALLYGQESGLPFYYRKLAGNIPDVKTVRNLLADLDYLGCQKIKLVMDRGFYSEENVNALFRDHLKFIMATKLNLTYVKQELNKVRTTIRNWENYDQRYELYAQTATIIWKYKQERPNKGDQIKQERRMYLHLFFNSEKAVEDEKKHNLLLIRLQQELESGKPKPEYDEDYKKYFEVTKTPVRGTKITPKQEAIDEAKKNYGYFALISNDIKDPIRALEIYRNKDLVEKAFGNLKERLNLRRTLVSSEQSLDGKLFVEFIALIYLSYIKKKMQDADLFKKYTLQGLMDEFDVIECFEQKGKDNRWGEMTKKQIELFTLMGVDPPSLHVSGI